MACALLDLEHANVCILWRDRRSASAFLARSNTALRRHPTVDDVQVALEAMRTKADGTSASAATVNTSIASVKSFLGFAHKVGFTRFNAAPLIKLRERRARSRNGSCPTSTLPC
jgi:hypothetical protein